MISVNIVWQMKIWARSNGQYTKGKSILMDFVGNQTTQMSES